MLMAFGARVDRVIINEVHGSVFHARMILSAENELHARKVIELDTRPSDSIAMAVQQGAPLFVARKVWETVEDMSETLAQIEQRGLESGTAADADLDDEEDAEDEDEDDDLDPDDLELASLEGMDLDDVGEEDDGEDDDDENYDDGYSGIDDDDDEGEEWKKKS
jgi:uncharacterized protein